MEGSTVIALLWAWLAEHPEEYCSFVKPFTQLRWSPSEKKLVAVRVGGHWRRLACWAKLAPALNCVCKFERLVKPMYLGTPPHARRLQYAEDGTYIPRKYRVLVWA